MVGYKDREIVKVPLEEVAGKLKSVSPDARIVKEAKMLGICFGDGKAKAEESDKEKSEKEKPDKEKADKKSEKDKSDKNKDKGDKKEKSDKDKGKKG